MAGTSIRQLFQSYYHFYFCVYFEIPIFGNCDFETVISSETRIEIVMNLAEFSIIK